MTHHGKIIAMKYGRLTLLSIELRHYPRTNERRSWATCRCKCGKTHGTWLASLKNGITRSCGCLHRELSAKRCKARKGVGWGHYNAGKWQDDTARTKQTPSTHTQYPLAVNKPAKGQARQLSTCHSLDEIMGMIEGCRKTA